MLCAGSSWDGAGCDVCMASQASVEPILYSLGSRLSCYSRWADLDPYHPVQSYTEGGLLLWAGGGVICDARQTGIDEGDLACGCVLGKVKVFV